MSNEPPLDSPEERADAWARALHWGTPEQLRARGIEPPSDSIDMDAAASDDAIRVSRYANQGFGPPNDSVMKVAMEAGTAQFQRMRTSNPWDHARAVVAALAAADPPLLVTDEMTAELEHLRLWKAEAMPVLSEWEQVWLAAGQPGPLGTSKAAAVHRFIDDVIASRGEQ